ncbi:MAG: adenosine kinase [Spirochaetes bacterium]|nr:adenosine kinase [Spirochaetota bacterium]
MNDVIGIGSALLDLTYEVGYDFLKELGLKKGTMQLIDESTSRKVLAKLEGIPGSVTPGGSAANTMAGIANLGGTSAFIGKVGRDARGDLYIEESGRAGVKCLINRHESLTGHAIALITPDSERTFATHLGAALHLSPEDVPAEEIQNSRILHVEGYLLEGDMKEASIAAMEIAKQNGVKISIDLADPSLITRNLGEFKRIVRNFADVVFVNEEEARAFTAKDAAEAIHIIYLISEVAVVKLGAEGSLIKAEDRVHTVSPCKTKVANTNGAGDMYAAGLLYGLARKMPIEEAGKLASYASSLVVAQVGARLTEKIDHSRVP